MSSSLAEYAASSFLDSSDQVEIIDDDADWSRFLKTRYKDDLETLSREYPFRRSLYIRYSDIESYGIAGTRFADAILVNPGKVLGDIRDAIKNHNLVKPKKGTDTPDLNIRITDLNLAKRINIRDIRSRHIGELISVEGIVRKSTEVQPRMTLAVYRCPSGHRTVKAQGYGTFIEPDGCQADGCNWGIRKMELLYRFSRFTDSQKLQIQESPEGMRGGNQPQSIVCVLDDDITGLVNPGDRITVNAIVRTMERKNQGERSTTFEKYLEVNSIEIAEKEFAEIQISDEDLVNIIELSKNPNIRDMLIQSISPAIFGMEDVKEALLYSIFGGIAKEMPDGSRLRGDIHVLLIGDPGIAKSQMIRHVIYLSPRGIFTSGQSSTSAGLTAAAVKDPFGNGGWTLEAGALVLADMGVCGVDEIDKMDKNDRSALHEAMEQQSVSIAKAGMVTSLKTRCAVIGAANPKYGKFDNYTAIGEQINMPPSLLSRFDFIFVLQDRPEKTFDNNLSTHILKAHQIGEKLSQNKIDGVEESLDISLVTPPISVDLFIKYVAHAKRSIFPVLSDGAFSILQNYYLKIRDLAGADKPVPITARSLEALVRTAEAVARTRLSKTISIDDAERTVRIIDISLRQVAFDPDTGVFDSGIITTGKSSSQWSLIEAIEQTVKALSEDGPADESGVIKALVSRGHEPHKIDRQITAMKESGKLTSPKNGLIKVVY